MSCRRWLASSLIAVAVMFTSFQSTKADLVISFSNETWAATSENFWAGFTSFTPTFAPNGVTGTLTAISADVVLEASIGNVWAQDLTVYLVPDEILAPNGLLQIGGVSKFNADESIDWVGGNSNVAGTLLQDTRVLTDSLVFNGNVNDPRIWIGNGYVEAGRSGTWTGSITFHGISAVPEPSTMLLTCLAVPAIAFVRRRRKKQ